MQLYPIPPPILDTLDSVEESIIKIFSFEFAKYELATALDFLKQYDGNPATFEAYRREVERLLQWAWLIAKKTCS
ncbi:MAG: Phage integrase family protein [Gammaproteobacteria bacterium]|jgi:hypothetical protein|nr:Phage integrase family protein [Gammaproteobacteria bacterium]